jgi:glycine hydroxymethyltransferase
MVLTSKSAIDRLIAQEEVRQKTTLNLIASENYTSPAVHSAMASVLTNKYAEGYPGKRYYAGCSIIDQVEESAIHACKKLFGVAYANVQPHAGSQANMAAYFAVLKPGDTILGMSLASGGHLTHGHNVNFSGSLYKSVQYEVCPGTGLIDYDDLEQLAVQHKPKLIIAGASSYSRIIDFARIAVIAKKIGALLLADIAHIAGLVATHQHPSPVGYADFITSTTHKTLRGPRGGLIMATAEFGQKIDRSIIPGTQGGPFMHVIAAKALTFELALEPEFTTYQKHVIEHATLMASLFQNLGYHVVSGGTDNHLFVLDLQNKAITGKEAEDVLERAGITVSRSCIPGDPQKPWITSGIRLGTPAITTRGISAQHIPLIVEYIDGVIKHHDNSTLIAKTRKIITDMMHDFPLFAQHQHTDNRSEPSAFLNNSSGF